MTLFLLLSQVHSQVIRQADRSLALMHMHVVEQAHSSTKLKKGRVGNSGATGRKDQILKVYTLKNLSPFLQSFLQSHSNKTHERAKPTTFTWLLILAASNFFLVIAFSNSLFLSRLKVVSLPYFLFTTGPLALAIRVRLRSLVEYSGRGNE